jgi:thioredoxin-dependent peroxiredoxin
MIGDTDLAVAKLYNMLPAEEQGGSEGRTAATNATVRSVFIIGPDKKIKLMMTYPMTTGRNFDEILRALDSIQMTAKYKVATPANWKQGDDVIISGSVSDEEAKTLFPGGWKAPKPYLRITKQPGR